MKYVQRDIVEINFMFPDGTFKPHPAVIVSNNELQEIEEFVYLALISSKEYNQCYSFALADEMLTFKMEKRSFVKCHLIVVNMERDVLRKLGRMKEPYFDNMVKKIIESIF
ncbi:MAG: type II toxin-antitoxin system PemK/MazF family toxin [Prevotellaceae bacterium]|jgi:mRNA-degrading endonuclease toxin of MazEF toxin-antitoxin module|nr:type II toxin-antitoxin system PemK/MazF family toxin [Prevotellaceae bacterium]